MEMSVRVTVKRRSEDIPEDMVYSALMSSLRMSREEYDRIKREDGSVTLYVRDPEAVLKLQRIGEKYPNLISVEFEESGYGGLFSSSFVAVRSNWSLALSWCAIVLVLGLLSLIPILGFFAQVFLYVFTYAFVLHASHELAKKEDVGTVFGNLSLGETLSSYLGAGFGFWLASFLLGVAVTLVGTLLLFFLGAWGGISDTLMHGAVGEGFSLSLFVAFSLLLILFLWFLYAFPLLVSKAIGEGGPTFESSFKVPFFVFKPSFIRESFSGEYLRVGGLWCISSTVGLMGFLLTLALLVTIPLSLLILYWIEVFLSLSASFCVRLR